MDFSLDRYFDLFDKQGEAKALEYKDSFIPDYLYKFYPMYDDDKRNEKRLNSLKAKDIWFSSPNLQNDPFEYKGLYFNEEVFEKYGVPFDLFKKYYYYITNGILLSAFTDNASTNIPMWAHYTNNHRGYCVKYKVNNKRAVFKIQYEEKRYDISKTALSFLSLMKQVDEKAVKPSALELPRALIMMNYYIKHSSWRYENEYRFIYPDEDFSEYGKNISMNELGLEYQEIYCGLKCDDKHYDTIRTISENILEVPYKKCTLSEDEFIMLI